MIDICISTQTNNIVGWVRTTGKLPLYLACNKFIIATRVGEASRILPEEMLISYPASPPEGKIIKDSSYPKRLADKILAIQQAPDIFNKKELGRKIVAKYFEHTKLSRTAANIIKKHLNIAK